MQSFVTLLEAYFQEEARRQGLASRHFRIGGRDIAIQFASTRWVGDLTAALAHLEQAYSHGPTDGLTVAMWDGATPPANHVLRAYLFTLTNWWFDYTGRRGELRDIHGGNIAAHYHPDTETLSLVDHRRRRAYYWKRSVTEVPYYEQCAPFRVLLHSYLRETGAQFVHGAAVGTAAGGVLLVGKGGSGKSTSALTCLNSPLQYAGDDYCLVAEDGSGGFDVHSLYCMAKLVERTDLDRFPGLERHVLNPRRVPGDKVAVSLREYGAGKLMAGIPLRAVLAPVITGGRDSSIVPCSVSEAMMSIAPTTLSQLPFSGREDLQFLGAMARRVPCFRLLLGSDLSQIPARILELLDSLGARAASREEHSVAAPGQ